MIYELKVAKYVRLENEARHDFIETNSIVTFSLKFVESVIKVRNAIKITLSSGACIYSVFDHDEFMKIWKDYDSRS